MWIDSQSADTSVDNLAAAAAAAKPGVVVITASCRRAGRRRISALTVRHLLHCPPPRLPPLSTAVHLDNVAHPSVQASLPVPASFASEMILSELICHAMI